MKDTLIIGEGFVGWQDKRCKAFHDERVQTTKTLLKWFKVPHATFKKIFKTANVFNHDGSENTELEDLVRKAQRVILLGRVAENTILNNKGSIPRIEFKGDHIFYVLPHPSGKNRILNNKKVRRTCEKLCVVLTQLARGNNHEK